MGYGGRGLFGRRTRKSKASRPRLLDRTGSALGPSWLQEETTIGCGSAPELMAESRLAAEVAPECFCKKNDARNVEPGATMARNDGRRQRWAGFSLGTEDGWGTWVRVGVDLGEGEGRSQTSSMGKQRTATREGSCSGGEALRSDS